MLLPQQVWTDPLTGDLKHIWQTFPIYYEYKEDGIDADTDAIKGTYLDSTIRKIWDLVHQQRDMRGK